MDDQQAGSVSGLSEDEAREIFSASSVAMVLTDPRQHDNPIIYVNRAFERLTGYSADIAVGRNCRFLQSNETDPIKVERLREAIMNEEEISVVLENERADGVRFTNALLVSPVLDKEGVCAYFVGFQTAVDRDQQSERLAHFENMVEEIQHRVKNHLAMILGLIRIRARGSDTPEEFTDLSRRIESLQLLYEEMSAATSERNDGKIQLGSYIGRVANAIAHLDSRPGVRMNVQVEPLIVDTETAVRIGLVLSEVLTNAMQHAFPDQSSGLVDLRVSRTDDGGMRAIVSDDGAGLPEGMDWPNTDGLGGRIVQGLCEGLNATLNVSRGAVGTIVMLDVPAAH